MQAYRELFQRFDRAWQGKRKDFELWGLKGEMIYCFPDERACMGNKLWKLYALYKRLNSYTHIFSYGSFQANSLLALSRFACSFDKKLFYYVPRIPNKTTTHPQSNYCLSLALGAQILQAKEKTPAQQAFEAYQDFTSEGGLGTWVSQGISGEEAQKGVGKLGSYLNEFLPETRPLCLPSGTGATAFFLSQSYKGPVITTPCIGSKDFLMKAFKSYKKSSRPLPQVISTQKKYPFGSIDPELFCLHQELEKKVNIDVDCLYDVKMFLALKENSKALPKKLYYLHCGGLEANTSMWARYKRKYFL